MSVPRAVWTCTICGFETDFPESPHFCMLKECQHPAHRDVDNLERARVETGASRSLVRRTVMYPVITPTDFSAAFRPKVGDKMRKRIFDHLFDVKVICEFTRSDGTVLYVVEESSPDGSGPCSILSTEQIEALYTRTYGNDE